MIYLNNNTKPQEVYISRNDGQGVPHKPSTNLEIGEITVTADTQTNYPSSGYVGFSSVVIDSSEYAQHNYDLGYNEGENDGYVSGVTDGEQSVIDTFTSTTITINGQYGSSANPYSSVTVNVAQTGHTDEELQEAYESGYTSGETHQKSLLGTTAFTINGSYSAENGYSAITVNVPQTGSTNSIISVTGNTWYVLDHYFGTGEQIEITNATFDYSVANGGRHQQLIAGGDCEWVRIGGNGDILYTSYYRDSKIDVGPTILDDDHILLTNGAFYINDMETPVSTFGPYPLDIFKDTRMVVFANTASGGDSVCGQTASVGVITIYDENDNVVDKYVPELHNGVVCLHNVISGNYITPSGTGTPTITNTDYSDGYNDGRQDVIDTFTAMTATTNGVYGSSAHPLSSITVNVHTSGSVISLVDYVHTTVLSASQKTAYIDTGIIPTTATTFRVQGMYKGYSQGGVIVGYSYNDSRDYRVFWAGGDTRPDIYYDFNGGRLGSFGNLLTPDTLVDITCDNYSITLNGSVLGTGATQTTIDEPHNILLDVGSWWVKSLEIWDNGVKVFDGQAAIDSDGNIGLYDSVSMSMVYNSGLTMAYEGTPTPIPSPDYQSGYTDGYASGYTDGASSSQSDLSKLVDKSITQADLQSGCTKIGSYAFYMCSYLTGVTIPNTVTEIGQYAFQNCYRLNDADIPDSVVYIRNNAFYGCEAISSVTFGNSIEQIGICAFQDCKSLTTVSIPDSISKISDGAFWGCTALTEVYIGSGITAFTAGAGSYGVFTGCDSLTDVYLYATTPPSYSQYTFTGVNHSITLHCPIGSDYSSYSLPSYWSIVYDL